MKILNKNKQIEALKLISACQIIATKNIKDFKDFHKITENLTTLSFLIGDLEGMEIVKNTIYNYKK